MAEPSIALALRELVERGLIAANPVAVALSPGNIDRREKPARTSWRVALPDGRPARLLLGPNLSSVALRQTAFARACPTLVPSVYFHDRLSNGDALADAFFPGASLESITESAPDRARALFGRVTDSLAATQRTSTENDRLAEWVNWTTAISGAAIWSVTERGLLASLVWPRLYPLLAAGPAIARWTNGDFTTANLLFNDTGEARVIDCEFAAETHFFREDAARFYALSPAARRRPDLFSPSVPRPGPAWHLFFWLRQFAMEATQNSEAYLARVRTQRLGVIRRLAENILGSELAGWSVASAPVQATLEIARWEQTPSSALYISGWCHVPRASLYSILVTRGEEVVAESGPLARPDVQAYFAGDPLALASGYSLTVPLSEPATPLVISAVIDDGSLLPLHTIQPDNLPGRGPWQEDYAAWSERFDPDPPATRDDDASVLFSILVPVFNPAVEFLRACLNSVIEQHYPNWELCVIDDGSTSPDIRLVLTEFAKADPRIKVVYRERNGGIARATNDAMQAALGDFIVLLDHDDRLRPHALAELANSLRHEPDLDAVYSDEEKISAEGTRVIPFLKPDFSPEFLLGVMYIGHALCVRTTVARAAGGFDSRFDGIQDYEFFLRVTEHTRRIGHLPRILYQWRQSAGSSALHGNVKGDMDSKQEEAVRAHLKRIGRTERIVRCGPHRLRLLATRIPTLEVFRAANPEEAIATLRLAVASSQSEVLVVICGTPLAMSDDWTLDLAAVASLPDSGLVGPLILSPDDRVRESGWVVSLSGTAPIMRGFASGRDGYNGSLPCTREVTAISPWGFAIARTLAKSALESLPADQTWLQFCEALLQPSRYNRVCPHAWIRLADLAPDFIERSNKTTSADPFYNPHFEALRGDYSLARRQPETTALKKP